MKQISIKIIIGGIIGMVALSCTSKASLELKEPLVFYPFGDLPENPQSLQVLTCCLYPQDQSMLVVYGNPTAFNFSQSPEHPSYPVGTVLYGVLWESEADEDWFGAVVPKQMKQIERIEVVQEETIAYSCYDAQGKQQKKPLNEEERIQYMLGQQKASSPEVK
ncbi:hypothetical protein [Myroides sp. TSA_177.3]|uniref:hypothetical protein n=1 Tax=Myroides sp. TSA_177.3 TaxID=3415650 RepID=UPI004045BCB6